MTHPWHIKELCLKSGLGKSAVENIEDIPSAEIFRPSDQGESNAFRSTNLPLRRLKQERISRVIGQRRCINLRYILIEVGAAVLNGSSKEIRLKKAKHTGDT